MGLGSPFGAPGPCSLLIAGTPLSRGEPVVEITGIVDDKQVLSLSPGGRVQEYALSKIVGFRVRGSDGRELAKGLSAVRDVLNERLKKKQVTRQQFADQLSLVSGTVDYTGFGNVPLLIEAVFEDLAVKHAVLKEAEAVLPPGAIFATNTSTIPIHKIAAASRECMRFATSAELAPGQTLTVSLTLDPVLTAGTPATSAVRMSRTAISGSGTPSSRSRASTQGTFSSTRRPKGVTIRSITYCRISSCETSGACCVETTTVSTRTGLCPSYSIVTCDLASGRSHHNWPVLRNCDWRSTRRCDR